MTEKKGIAKYTGVLIALGVIAAGIIVGFSLGKGELTLNILKAVGLGVLGITILVTVHEMGHFLTARMFGIKVDTFSIGFPPVLFSVKRGDTEYQIGATPLGGYVKIAGMIDESLDTEYIGKPAQPWEFRSKPVWQRLIVMLGGIIFNVILAILIFSVMKWQYGDRLLPVSAMTEGIYVSPGSMGDKLGFRNGDRLLSLNGEAHPYFDDYLKRSVLRKESYFTLIRDGQEMRLDIPRLAINMLANDSIKDKSLFEPAFPSYIMVDEQNPEAPAYRAGLRTGDRILSLNGQPVTIYQQIPAVLAKSRESGSDTVRILYLRGVDSLRGTTTLTAEGKLLILPDTNYLPKATVVRYNFFKAFIPGTKSAFFVASSQAQGLGRLAEPGVQTGKLIQGPIRIFKMLYDQFVRDGWRGFLYFTGLLSMILAVMNLLPIPALDGGHVVFLLIEAVMRREPPLKLRMVAQQIGMILVLLLMVYVIFNDIIRLALG